MPTLILLAALLLPLVIGALLGLLRGWKKATARIVSVILAFVLALIISGSIVKSVNPAAIADVLGDSSADLTDFLTAAPTLFALMLGLVRPIFFFALFFGLTAILWIVYLIVSLFLRSHKSGKSRLIGAAIGAAQGLFVALVLMTPLLGTVSVVDSVMVAQLEGTPSAERTAVATMREETLAPVTENGLFKAAAAVTRPLYRSLTTVKVGDTKINPQTEISICFNAVHKVDTLTGKGVAEYGDSEKAALRSLSGFFSDSVLMPSITAEVLSTASTKWSNGETFLGTPKPEVEGEFHDVVDSLIVIFKDSTKDTVTRDFDTIVEFIILLADYDVAEAMTGNADVFERVTAKNPATDKTFIKAAIELLDANPHLAPLRAGIMSLGAQTVISQLGTSEEIRANCGDMVSDLVAQIKETEGGTDEEKIAAMTPSIREELAANDITVSDEIVDEASRFLLDELDERNITISDLTEDDIFDILDELAAKGVSTEGSGT